WMFSLLNLDAGTLFESPEEEEKVIRMLTESFLDNFHGPLEQIADKLNELQYSFSPLSLFATTTSAFTDLFFRQSQDTLLSAINIEREKLESIPVMHTISQTVSFTLLLRDKATKPFLFQFSFPR